MTTTRFAAAFVAAALFTAPAAAQAPAQGRVPLVDLRLDRTGDVRTLDRRIARMAEALCGTPSDADLAGKNAAAACRVRTIASVAPQRTAAITAAQQVAARTR